MGKAILGEVEFSVVESEEPERENQITEKAVESGSNVNDHVQPRSLVFNIVGVVTGPDAAQKLSKLGIYRNKGELLTYVGRNLFNNMVIERFKTRHEAKVRDGFEFDITLKEVRIAIPQNAVYVGPDPVSSSPAGAAGTRAQAGTVSNKGTQQQQNKAVEDSLKQGFLAESKLKVPRWKY